MAVTSPFLDRMIIFLDRTHTAVPVMDQEDKAGKKISYAGETLKPVGKTLGLTKDLFYNATLNLWTEGNKARTAKTLVWGEGSGYKGFLKIKNAASWWVSTSDKLNAYVGGYQMSVYLHYGLQGYNPFDDPVFTKYVLNFYSNIKVWQDGTYQAARYNIPKAFKYKYGKSGIKAWEGLKNWRDGAKVSDSYYFSVLSTAWSGYSAYHDFLYDRLDPGLLGGLPASEGSPYLPSLLMKKLGKSPSFGDANLRRAFLLMGGDFYGENDLPYLNIMKAKGQNQYGNIPADVRTYWKTHYPNARSIEEAETLDSGLLGSLESYLGEKPTLQVFAKYITHGAPKDKQWAQKVYPHDSSVWVNPTDRLASGPIVTWVASPITSSNSQVSNNITMIYPNVKTRWVPIGVGELYGGIGIQQPVWKNSYGPKKKGVRTGNTLEDIGNKYMAYSHFIIHEGGQAIIDMDGKEDTGTDLATYAKVKKTSYLGNYDDTSYGTSGGKSDGALGMKNYCTDTRRAKDFIDQGLNVYDQNISTESIKNIGVNNKPGAILGATINDIGNRSIIRYPKTEADKVVPSKNGQSQNVNSSWETDVYIRPGIASLLSKKGVADIFEVDSFPFKDPKYGELSEFPVSVRIGLPPKISSKKTLLDLDPKKAGFESLLEAFDKAVRAKAKTVTYWRIESMINYMYRPLEYMVAMIADEHTKLKARAAAIENAIKDYAGKPEEIAKAADRFLLTPTSMQKVEDREAIAVQLWTDSVNNAAYKASQFLARSRVNIEAFVRFMIIKQIVDENTDADTAAKLKEKVGLDAKKNPIDVSPAFNFKTPPPPPKPKKGVTTDELEEALKDRRRNADQCLLSTKIALYREHYREAIYDAIKKGSDATNIHEEGKPFGGRFHLLGHSRGEYTEIPTLILNEPGRRIRPLLNMTPDILSALVPKIRLFKVTNIGNREVEIEFEFSKYVSSRDIYNMRKSSTPTRGYGGGIKSFSWSYEGTTPATAKKDINAELTLYFQGFDELTKQRKSTSGRTYKYIDLLLYPGSDKKQVHPNQFNPSNFRIRADVGYHQRTDASFRAMLEARKYELFPETLAEKGEVDVITEFNTALNDTNKTLLLNMVDHDINFNNDGSCEIKITYAAYIESEARSAKYNALSTPEIEYFRNKSNEEINKLLRENKCTIQELNAIRKSHASMEKSLIRAAQGSIVRRLITRNRQRRAFYDKKEVDKYLEDYATLAPDPISTGLVASDKVMKAKAREPKDGEMVVNYYMLGDIIHTIMDCLYEPVKKPKLKNYNPLEDPVVQKYDKRIPELSRFKPLFSSFLYSDYNSKKPIFTANIVDIPISSQFFNQWLVDNVVKSERQVYPLMEFIKDLLQAVVDLMTDACINRQVDVSLMFQTSQVMGLGEKDGKKWKDKLSTYDYVKKGKAEIVVDSEYAKPKNSLFPLAATIYAEDNNNTRNPIKAFYNYSLMYAVSPTLSVAHTGRGSQYEDESIGCYHFRIGSNKGLLKNIKFSKTDMAYLREARYYNQGTYGLLQLGAVYNVTLETVGNTLFYPGMEIYIDPKGFGGSDWDPTVGGSNRSTANALGIGGYHVITKVENNISRTGFTQTLTCLFQYAGDGESRTMALDGKTNQKLKPDKLEMPTPKKKDLKCVNAVNDALIKEINAKNKLKKKGKKKNKKI